MVPISPGRVKLWEPLPDDGDGEELATPPGEVGDEVSALEVTVLTAAALPPPVGVIKRSTAIAWVLHLKLVRKPPNNVRSERVTHEV